MSHRLPRDPHKEQFWRSHFDRWKRSGLSVRHYCSRHQLAEASFYGWKRTLALRDAQTAKPSSTPLTFLPLHLPATVPTVVSRIEIVLRNGTRLRLPGDLPATRVRELVAALEGPSC